MLFDLAKGLTVPHARRSRKLDTAVSRLRRKLINTGVSIVPVRGVGWRLEWPGRIVRSKSILVIEDDPAMQRALVRTLREVRVEVASSVAEARELVRDRRYAALIVDLGLPDGCGSTIIPIVQRQKPPPAVMIVTARSDADAVRMSGRFGVPYCTKPVDPTFIRTFAARALS